MRCITGREVDAVPGHAAVRAPLGEAVADRKRGVVARADTVVTAARSPMRVHGGQWLQPGCLVSAAGTRAPKGRAPADPARSRTAQEPS